MMHGANPCRIRVYIHKRTEVILSSEVVSVVVEPDVKYYFSSALVVVEPDVHTLVYLYSKAVEVRPGQCPKLDKHTGHPVPHSSRPLLVAAAGRCIDRYMAERITKNESTSAALVFNPG